ncbi:MAG: hypothetical protein KA521_03635 [Crocinitomicaceae bacterium]|nr:hypothetical protein [Crocinitomicaceae bacterium]
MKKHLVFFGIFLLGILSSCIEITDDITLNADGSGLFKYVINLSESKVKVNSILALDSIEGKKVPTLSEIEAKIGEFKKTLATKQGISNVKIESDFTNFIFKLSCNFSSVNTLQTAVKEVIKEISNEKNSAELEAVWLKWDGQKLERSIPDLTIKKTKELKTEDIEQLKKGKYTSISRFSKPIEKCMNPSSVISKNKLAAMLQTNIYSLTKNPKLLENTIYLIPNKN